MLVLLVVGRRRRATEARKGEQNARHEPAGGNKEAESKKQRSSRTQQVSGSMLLRHGCMEKVLCTITRYLLKSSRQNKDQTVRKS